MTYNYLDSKLAKSETPKAFDKYLDESRKDSGFDNSPKLDTLGKEIAKKDHTDPDASKPFNAILQSARTGTHEAVVEKVMGEDGAHRTDKYYKTTVPPLSLVNEAYDSKRREDYVRAQNAQDRDTAFWDDKVGDEMIGKITKVPANTQKSQLENNPDRFHSLQQATSMGGGMQDIERAENKDFQVDKMITASLKDADAMLFHIYANAVGRKLSGQEKAMVNDINAAKIRVLTAQMNDPFSELLDIYKKYENKTGVISPEDDGLQDPNSPLARSIQQAVHEYLKRHPEVEPGNRDYLASGLRDKINALKQPMVQMQNG